MSGTTMQKWSLAFLVIAIGFWGASWYAQHGHIQRLSALIEKQERELRDRETVQPPVARRSHDGGTITNAIHRPAHAELPEHYRPALAELPEPHRETFAPWDNRWQLRVQHLGAPVHRYAPQMMFGRRMGVLYTFRDGSTIYRSEHGTTYTKAE